MAHVVIGANFGDEGKGVATDYLASQLVDPIVVRFNGGAQAGHTVVTPEGLRHVFHHFGSGSFTGAATYLSQFFICNPILFFQEWDDLIKMGVTPKVYVSPDALVTTPYDMLLNQIAERHRGDGRHGSCGVGINETVHRSLTDIAIQVGDLEDWLLRQRLEMIRSNWVPIRLKQLGITSLTDDEEYLLNSNGVIDNFVAMAKDFRDCTRHAAIGSMASRPLIFEGAQGLLLDEHHSWFPHVTRSRTGLTNVLALAAEANLDRLDVTYMSRAYMTRHGAGPFPSETKGVPYKGIVDQTNVPHPYQGTLRFGHLDLNLLHNTIQADLAQATLPVTARLALTCTDQVDPVVTYHDGKRRRAPLDRFIAMALSVLNTPGLVGSGPTRKDMQPVSDLVAA